MADAPTYVDLRDGGYYVAGSRVSLASIIYSFRGGDSPETIRQNFPTLTLAQVYGALAFYLNHPAESEAYLREEAEQWDELKRQSSPPTEDQLRRIEASRQRMFVRK